ncbi:MAG: hypothetical protein FWC36_07765 [Spirochaetes bacterium]|nr:hypothetical protein [Spirochaetota bacterium]
MLETPSPSAIPFAKTVLPLPRDPDSAIIEPGTSFRASFFPALIVSSVEHDAIVIR